MHVLHVTPTLSKPTKPMKLTKQRWRELNATIIQRPLLILHSLVWAFDILLDSADDECKEVALYRLLCHLAQSALADVFAHA